ncbi:MAG: hypothetical protein ABIQ16_08795 [Polyangiaceae bacterium]
MSATKGQGPETKPIVKRPDDPPGKQCSVAERAPLREERLDGGDQRGRFFDPKVSTLVLTWPALRIRGRVGSWLAALMRCSRERDAISHQRRKALGTREERGVLHESFFGKPMVTFRS